MNDPDTQKHDGEATCPQCGARLPDDSPRGLCPRCLMAGAMIPTGDSGAASSPPESPSIKEVQAAFPQLEILELAGAGGMGVVYKARQTSLNRLVALKLLAPHREKEAGFSERFTREAQALAALNHPNIVTVHDFGQTDGFYYLIMEFVDGVNLRQAIRAERFTPEQALAIVPPICEALQYAHDRGIVHRDIKPENLLLDKEGRVKVADFGIARILSRRETATGSIEKADEKIAPGLTAGTALGTPHYMAPEQAEHPEQVDHRADIYSLGAVFYEMLTGEPPDGRLQPPSTRVRIDVRLDEVVLKALADSPELRWQSATDLRTQVETIAATEAPPPRDAASTTPPEMPSPPNQADFPSRQHRGKAALWVGIGLSILAVPLILGSVFLLIAVDQDPDWNPAPQEAFFSFAIWTATLAVLFGTIISFAVSLGRRAGPARKRSGLLAAGLVLLLVIISMPSLTIVGTLAGSRAKAAEAQQRIREEMHIKEAQAELELREAESASITDPEDRQEQVRQIEEARRRLREEAGRFDEARRPSAVSRESSPTDTAVGVSLLSLLFFVFAVIGLSVVAILLIARASKGAAVGCAVFLVIGILLLMAVAFYLSLAE